MKTAIKFLTIVIALFYFSGIAAQELQQNIRGKVIDEVTGYPLSGATVVLSGTNPVVGTITDREGFFEIRNVPVGRKSLEISFVGYEPRFISNLLLTSAKETFLEISLPEKVTELDEVTVKSFTKKEAAQNEMAMISSRSFTIEETKRFAGCLGDPARGW